MQRPPGSRGSPGMRSLEGKMVETPVSRGRTVLADYSIPVDVLSGLGLTTKPQAQRCVQGLRQRGRLRERLMTKVRHRVYAKECAKTTTDRVATHWWLAKGGLGADTEARVIAPQDGVTETRRAYEARILQRV